MLVRLVARLEALQCLYEMLMLLPAYESLLAMLSLRTHLTPCVYESWNDHRGPNSVAGKRPITVTSYKRLQFTRRISRRRRILRAMGACASGACEAATCVPAKGATEHQHFKVQILFGVDQQNCIGNELIEHNCVLRYVSVLSKLLDHKPYSSPFCLP